VTGRVLEPPSPSCSEKGLATLRRSSHRIVHSAFDVKSWNARVPSVAEARPGRCPCCGAAGAPAGARVQLHGHGLRTRLVQGPLRPDGAPEAVEILVRRYLCRRCGAVLLVVPQGVLRARLFSASAIGLALALWALHRLPAPAVRRRVSPWRTVGATAADGWASLRRWVRQASRIFAGVRPCPERWTARQRAERIAVTLAACAPEADGPLLERVFFGAAQAG